MSMLSYKRLIHICLPATRKKNVNEMTNTSIKLTAISILLYFLQSEELNESTTGNF
jgi:hypothetical protein